MILPMYKNKTFDSKVLIEVLLFLTPFYYLLWIDLLFTVKEKFAFFKPKVDSFLSFLSRYIEPRSKKDFVVDRFCLTLKYSLELRSNKVTVHGKKYLTPTPFHKFQGNSINSRSLLQLKSRIFLMCFLFFYQTFHITQGHFP